MKENYIWFSFSFEGKNQGVCLIRADTPEQAQERAIEVGCIPEDFDHVEALIIHEEEIELETLISSKEMDKRGYGHTKGIVDKDGKMHSDLKEGQHICDDCVRDIIIERGRN